MSVYDSRDFNPDTAVGYLTKRIFQTSVKGMEPAFDGEDISHLQWSAMASIGFGRGQTCRALAHDLGHDKGATTRLVDTLEERNFVTRDRDATDRRVVNLMLTPQGEEITKRCMVRVVELWNGWLSDWSPDEVEQLIESLQRLRNSLETAVSETPCD